MLPLFMFVTYPIQVTSNLNQGSRNTGGTKASVAVLLRLKHYAIVNTKQW